MTQPVSPWREQTGVDLNVPPTSLPCGTSTLKPGIIASFISLAIGFPSISWAISVCSIQLPWLWPIRTNCGPLLYFGRYSFQGSANIASAGCERPLETGPHGDRCDQPDGHLPIEWREGPASASKSGELDFDCRLLLAGVGVTVDPIVAGDCGIDVETVDPGIRCH